MAKSACLYTEFNLLLLLSAVIFRPVLDYIEASEHFAETEYELAKKVRNCYINRKF